MLNSSERQISPSLTRRRFLQVGTAATGAFLVSGLVPNSVEAGASPIQYYSLPDWYPHIPTAALISLHAPNGPLADFDSALVTLENAKNNLAKVKSQQETAVKNAYLALLNSTNAAIPNSGNLSGMTPTISGTYNGSAKGSYVLSVSSGRYYVNGLESSSGTLSTSLTVLGTKGLYFQFSSITPALYSGNDSWTIEIPNTQASNYVTNLNIYNAALETQSSSVSTAESTVSASMSSYDQAIAALNLKKGSS
jgi:hypothetical protein